MSISQAQSVICSSMCYAWYDVSVIDQQHIQNTVCAQKCIMIAASDISCIFGALCCYSTCRASSNTCLIQKIEVVCHHQV
jgi:hypothetical protein